MSTTLSQLGQLRPADTNAASLYSPAANVDAVIRQIIVCNTSGAASTFRIFHDDNGTTYDQGTALFYDVAIAADETLVLDVFICMDDDTGNVAVRSGNANALTFTAYGSEQA